MGRKVGSEKTTKKELGGAEKARKRRKKEEENKKLSETAAIFFRKMKPEVDTAIAAACSSDQLPTATKESNNAYMGSSSSSECNTSMGAITSTEVAIAENVPVNNALNQPSDHQSIEANSLQELDPSDPSTWAFPLTDSNRTFLIEIGPTQKKLNNYVEKDGRRFSSKDYFGQKKNGETYYRNWLLYSESSNSMFCYPCCLFSSQGRSPWSNYGKENLGFSNFKHKHESGKRIGHHEQSNCHMESVSLWKACTHLKEHGKSINLANETVQFAEISHWRGVLKGILDSVLFLATHNLAFRGVSDNIQDDNCGNFLGLIKLLSKYYPPLTTHINRLERASVSYLSHDIQNQFINLCGKFVRKVALQNVKSRKYYSILFDSTPDSSHKKKVSQILRTVSCSKTGYFVEETFIDFISTIEKTGRGLSEVITDKIKKDGLNISDCRGQGYDNGSNMAGIYNGVQKWITDENALAVYVPCAAHSLNLFGVNVAEKILPAKLALGKIQNIYTFFAGSTKRWKCLMDKLSVTLKGDSKTRWSAKSAAVSAFSHQYVDVVEVLTEMAVNPELNSETLADANSRLNDMLNFKLLLSVTIWQNILFKIELCNRTIQNKCINIENANSLLSALLIWFHEFRLSGFKDCYLQAKCKAELLDIDECIGFETVRRTRGRKRTRTEEFSEDTDLSNLKRFEVEFFNELIDKLIYEIRNRFEQIRKYSELFGFLWGPKLGKMTECELEKCAKDLCMAYSRDFDMVQFVNEIKFLKHAVLIYVGDGSLEQIGPLDVLNILYKNEIDGSFHNVEIALIFLTLPVTVATNERSFSKIKLIKNYLRSSMGQERLSNLAILSIENQIVKLISFDEIINDIVNDKCRKAKIQILP